MNISRRIQRFGERIFESRIRIPKVGCNVPEVFCNYVKILREELDGLLENPSATEKSPAIRSVESSGEQTC